MTSCTWSPLWLIWANCLLCDLNDQQLIGGWVSYRCCRSRFDPSPSLSLSLSLSLSPSHLSLSLPLSLSLSLSLSLFPYIYIYLAETSGTFLLRFCSSSLEVMTNGLRLVRRWPKDSLRNLRICCDGVRMSTAGNLFGHFGHVGRPVAKCRHARSQSHRTQDSWKVEQDEGSVGRETPWRSSWAEILSAYCKSSGRKASKSR